MQQTKLDAWLKSRFVYFHEIHCLVVPKLMPPGTTVRRNTNLTTSMWRFVIVCPSDQVATLVIAAMVRERLSYSLVTKTRKGWWVKHLSPPDKRSFTYQWVWRCAKAGCTSGFFFLSPLARLRWLFGGFEGAGVAGDLARSCASLAGSVRSLVRI